ncbi:MAG: hypothetical protein FWD88_00805 [Treponema sp.]|nr:hypothetical protein [Treponema sp.]
MSDFKSENAYPPTSVLDVMRKNAIWCFAGGLVLIALRLVSKNFAMSAIVGGGICAVGVGWLMANNPVNKKTGVFIIALGILQAFSRFPVAHVALFAGTLLGIASMWLLVTGVKNLIMYFVAQGKRR